MNEDVDTEKSATPEKRPSGPAQAAQMADKPLLNWMRSGDPHRVPIFFGSPAAAVANYLGIEPEEATPELQERTARQLGIELQASLGGPSLLDVAEFCPDVQLDVERTPLADGTIRQVRRLHTPAGVLSDLREHPPGYGLEGIKEFFVKSEDDLPALACWVQSAARAVVEDPRVREKFVAQGMAKRAQWSPDILTMFGVWTPVFALTCTKYMGPDMAVYFITDHTSLFEELMETYWETIRVFFQVGTLLGADVFKTAINGLEWYSPTLYRRYMVPQARQLFSWVRAAGKLSWLHTCGRMNKLIFDGTYDRDQMGVDVLESFSNSPLGDVEDLKAARARLGDGMTTRGGINIGAIYAGAPDEVRARTREVMEATQGYRHMVGDTDTQFPGTPRDNILALIESVCASGRAFRS